MRVERGGERLIEFLGDRPLESCWRACVQGLCASGVGSNPSLTDTCSQSKRTTL